MYNINVDHVIEYVKTLSENSQCTTCGSLICPCVRYTCGHWICKHCADKSGECLSCIYHFVSSYSTDKPLTHRVNNASNLFTTFQDAFQIDVHQRLRISNQLKLEKQLFPGCIQAPNKYSNKRKSSNIFVENKENIKTLLPGEEISSMYQTEMSRSFEYVQNWLNQQENALQNIPRKPFTDIYINNQSLILKKKEDVVKLKKVNNANSNVKSATYRIRSHFKTLNKTQSSLNKSNLKIKERKQNAKICKKKEECDWNESGIVIEDVEDENNPTLVLDNTKTNTDDKDKLAWLAVIAAEKKNPYTDESDLSQFTLRHNIRCDEQNLVVCSDKVPDVMKTIKLKTDMSKFVPFYKKSTLFETCKQCRHFINNKICPVAFEGNEKNVSIVINNATFKTTIKFNHYVPRNYNTIQKNSIAIQTHTDDYCKINTTTTNEKEKLHLEHEMLSLKTTTNDDTKGPKLFNDKINNKVDENRTITIQNICNAATNRTKCLTIEESDSDSYESLNNIHEVVVDVHKSNENDIESGILQTLSKCDHHPRSKRPLRDHTPNSTDSSDKENLDPNRMKRARFGKKKKNKKGSVNETNSNDHFIKYIE